MENKKSYTLSIITINWNNDAGLKKTIESVIPQLNHNVQYIIVDGESEDDSKEIIHEYSEHISKIIIEPNKGIYGNMNRGIKEAFGEYCLFLNSGDWLNEHTLEKALSECDGTDILYFNTYLSYRNTHIEKQTYPETLSMRSFYKATIGHQSTFIRTALFTKYGLYNEDNTIHSDYEFWLKSIIKGQCSIKHSPLYISYYDMGGRSSKQTKEMVREIEKIQKRYLPERVLTDYEFWNEREKDLAVLLWYKKKKTLYRALNFIFKIATRVNKLRTQDR